MTHCLMLSYLSVMVETTRTLDIVLFIYLPCFHSTVFVIYDDHGHQPMPPRSVAIVVSWTLVSCVCIIVVYACIEFGEKCLHLVLCGIIDVYTLHHDNANEYNNTNNNGMCKYMRHRSSITKILIVAWA